MSKGLETFKYLKMLLQPHYFDEEIEIVEKELNIVDILEKHIWLDLDSIYECDSYDDFIDEYVGTTNELEYEEWHALKLWHDKALTKLQNKKKNK